MKSWAIFFLLLLSFPAAAQQENGTAQGQKQGTRGGHVGVLRAGGRGR